MAHKHTLWNTVEPYGPFYCDREDWKVCPEHKHLTLRQPSLSFNVTLPDVSSNAVTVNDYEAAARESRVYRWAVDPKNLEESLAKANKIIDRAKKHGLEGGFSIDVDYANGYPEIVVTGEPYAYNGWSFVAVIEHLGDGNALIKKGYGYDGDDVGKEALEDSTLCEHCHKKRHRRIQVIVEKDGERKIVGSKCMKDFLGWEYTPILNTDIDEFSDEVRGFSESASYSQADILNVALATRDVYGFKSASASHSMDDEGGPSTKRRVEDYISSPNYLKDERITAMLEMKEYGAEIAEIQKTVADEIAKGTDNDYMMNMKAAYSMERVFPSTLGLVVSGISMNERRKRKETMDKIKKDNPIADTIFAPTGSRVTVKATLIGQNSFETAYGVTTIYTFLGEGHKFKWFASSSQGLETGTDYIITGTVKDLSVYKNESSTLLTRCKITQ